MSATVAPGLAEVAPWLGQVLVVGVASARFALAFAIMPLFAPTVIPAMVRNSLIVTFGLIGLAAMPQDFTGAGLSAANWVWLFAKEAVAGTVIGFFFGTIIWALGAAGEIVDTKVGATVGQLMDPMSGQQESLTANLLSRFAQMVFVSAGGLTLLVGTLMTSYAVWPLGPGGIRFDPAAVVLFEGEFGRLFALAFIVASPIIIVLYLIDAGMGLLNRFAQQFNVFVLSMPIKAAAAILVLIMILPLLADTVVSDLSSRADVAGAMLERVGVPR